MICTDCRQRDVCDLAGKDDPLLTGCDASHGTWAFDRLRLDRMTADRDALRAELDAAHDGEDALRSEVTRLRAQIAALQPEERRVGPDEVVVGREEWEAVQEFADLIVPIRDNLSGISWIGKLSDVFAAYDRWYAVRTSAQAHNGEESK